LLMLDQEWQRERLKECTEKCASMHDILGILLKLVLWLCDFLLLPQIGKQTLN
jgi:hypothetical protein